MNNDNKENFDQEDRNFYSEGQRATQDTTEKTDPLNRNQSETKTGEEHKSSSAQNETTPDQENRNNSLQNDSDNDPSRRTLDEYNANEDEPDEANGLENADLNHNNSNKESDPLKENYDSYDNDAEDDDIKENNLRDAFNNDDLDRNDQSDFEDKNADAEDKLRYSDKNLDNQNPNINEPDPFKPKRF
jgi:hypothetical protein